MNKLPFRTTRNRALTTWRFMKDPYSCYRKWKQELGDTFVVKALNGDVVVTCDPVNIKTTFAATTDEVAQFAVETTEALLMKSSVLLIDGPRHRQERRILSPSFNHQCLFRYVDLVGRIATNTANSWKEGETIRIMDPALRVSLDVIIEVVFGVSEPEKVRLFREHIKRFVSSFHPILAFTKLFQRSWFGLSPWNRFLKHKHALEQLLDREIEEVLAYRSESEDSSRGMLSRILGEYESQDGRIDQENVRTQLITMLLAGHETTQIAIAWGMSWLHRNPESLEELRGELRSQPILEVVNDSKLLNGICLESLRLNAVIPDIVRTLKAPMDWQGVTLPTGTNIGVSISLVHENSELYPEPFEFRPHRWDDRKPKPTEFLPFGGGVRRCLGAPLSIMEFKIVIATWVKNFEFRLPSDVVEVEPLYRRNVTMAPKSGIELEFVGKL